MNIGQIAQNVHSLLLQTDPKTFIFDLLTAYGKPKASVTRLQAGEYNISKDKDYVLWKNNVFFSYTTSHTPEAILTQMDALKDEMLQRSVLHADETPVQMLKPGNGKTHRAYLWAYAPGAFEDLKAVVYDFCESRAGENARSFLSDWRGSLVCDDFAGYKAGFAHGVTEAGCLAHARRKFFDLHASSKSQVAESALQQIGMVYEIEREVHNLTPDD